MLAAKEKSIRAGKQKAAKLANLIDHSRVIDAKNSNDTIKVWESHREQALLWRALALLQIPLTLLTMIFCLMLWVTREVTLNVPHKPLPGVYTAEEVPQSEFVDFATDYVNLIATYQPAVSERQFMEARKMLVEPMLSKFDVDMMRTELKAIQDTKRTQIFFVDPTKTQVNYEGRMVHVVLIGERFKIIAGREMPVIQTAFIVQMTTIPKNKFNPYGIVITNVNFRNET